MPSPRHWLQTFPNLGLDFWLALPLVGIIFWGGGNFLSNQVFSLPRDTAEDLEANARTRVQLSFSVLVILVYINQERGFTEIEVKTDDANVKELDFVFPFTKFEQVEAAIAQELNLSLEEVRSLARYQMVNE